MSNDILNNHPTLALFATPMNITLHLCDVTLAATLRYNASTRFFLICNVFDVNPNDDTPYYDIPFHVSDVLYDLDNDALALTLDAILTYATNEYYANLGS